MTSSFFADIVNEIDNDYATLVADGVSAGDTTGYIDTGSYIFNGLVSGSIFGGVPSTKSLLLQVRVALVRLSFVLALLSTSWNLILMLEYSTSSPSLLLARP